MWEKVLPWIGGIFAGIGIILILFDIIGSIKQRNKTKTNIVGLVLLGVAVIGYVITDVIIRDSAWPPLASLIWIGLFWAYVILDACLTVGAVKKVRRNKKTAATLSQEEQPKDDADSDHAENNVIDEK
ncbi:MAG: hypothetical protein J1G02_02500 [Clostridiales bacterium]|nr:hypothetical protein [Clostridiales bacterium]